MFSRIKSPEQRRLTVRCWMSFPLVVLFSIGAAASVVVGHWHGWPAYVVAVLPALPILWVIYEFGVYLAHEKDEFMRLLLAQCLLGGIGGTLATTTIWGFLEDFAHVPRMHLVSVYPLFWLFVVASWPVVWRRYR